MITTAYADRIKELRIKRAWSQDVLAPTSPNDRSSQGSDSRGFRWGLLAGVSG